MNNGQPTSAHGVMKLLPDSKQGVEIFSRQLITAVHDGQENALRIKALFKILEKVSEKFDAETKVNQMNEAAKYGEKRFQAFGFEIEQADFGKYDYLTCGDPVYEQLHAEMKAIQEKMKQREAFLKSIKDSMTIVDEASGEVSKVRPPVKKGAEGLKLTLK